nr:uncharacterized protein LOC112777508 [Arachis hypogaea]
MAKSGPSSAEEVRSNNGEDGEWRASGHPSPEYLVSKSHYCFLDGYTGHFQIHIAPEDQAKTTFTYPFGTFAYKRMSFGLCNASATFQRKIEALMKKYGVIHKVSTAYHPQTNGQAEVSNREIKRILEKVVNPQRKDWSSRLGDALWAYRTIYKTPIRMSPFCIVFGKPCHLPVEIQHRAYWAVKNCNPYLKGAGMELKIQLDELECLKLEAYENAQFYKEKAKAFHDQNIRRKNFKIGDEVGWAIKVVDVQPYGVVEVIHPTNGIKFKVNGHRVKLYHAQPKQAKELEIFLVGEVSK